MDNNEPDLNISMNKYLTCPVCKEIAVCPIFGCGNGHILCGICKCRLRRCPLCNNDDLSHNKSLELILRSEGVMLPCRNAHLGCAVQIRPSEMKHHVLYECSNRLLHCSEWGTQDQQCDGDKQYSPTELFEHWKRYHKISKIQLSLPKRKSKSLVGSIVLKPHVPLRMYEKATGPVKEHMHWPPQYFELDKNVFFLHMRGEGGKIQFWVTLLGEVSTMKHYKYAVAFNSEKRINAKKRKSQICWNDMPVHNIRFYEIHTIRAIGQAVTMDYDSLKLFPRPAGNGYLFELAIDVFKAEKDD